jgi:hypothetical protein
MNPPTDYTQTRAGDGTQGPALDAWRPWKHSQPVTREQVRSMAAKQYLREAGFERRNFERPHTFTVWHYRQGDPLHPNGRPMTAHAVTMIATPDHATA